MADTQHPVTPSSSEEAGYELSDSGLGAAVFFAGVLTVLLGTSIFATVILLGYFRIETSSLQDEVYSTVDIEQLPSGVRLQVNPARDWVEFNADYEDLLHNASDDKDRLSIDEAMDIISEQGLPAREE